jgi:hypothetical protein
MDTPDDARPRALRRSTPFVPVDQVDTQRVLTTPPAIAERRTESRKLFADHRASFRAAARASRKRFAAMKPIRFGKRSRSSPSTGRVPGR